MKNCRRLKPSLVAMIKFLEWTPEHRLRRRDSHRSSSFFRRVVVDDGLDQDLIYQHAKSPVEDLCEREGKVAVQENIQ